MGESIEWVIRDERFAELAPHWRTLLDDESMPFDTHEWFTAWWAAFGAGRSLRVCVAWRGDRLVAALPLARRSPRRVEALANVHTPVFRILAADPAACQSVVSAALGDGVAGFEAFGVPTSDPGLAALRARVEQLAMRELVEPAHVSPIVETSGDREEWRRGSKGQWGAPLERFRRKMDRDHDARFVIVEPPSRLETDLDRGFAVEASGWKGRQGTAIESSPATAKFYRDVARAFHERGELRLSGIELDDRLVAFDLTLLHGGRLHLLKTGYDESARKLAPGLVMRLSVIERCFEMGLKTHELLGDDTEWKRKFSTAERPHASLRAYPKGSVGLARYGYRAAVVPRLKRLREAVSHGRPGAAL